MAAEQIAPGLWRWLAPHPDWRPPAAPGSDEDWEELVGSVLYELQHVAVLIDPLLPRDGRDDFLRWLDDTVAGRAVSILTTVRWHRRDRDELAARYGPQTPGAWNAVPRGVAPKPLRGAGETVYWLPGAAACVFGDSVLGSGSSAVSDTGGAAGTGASGGGGGGLRVCPESWLEDVAVDRAGLARLLQRLLELPLELAVPTHGAPVLRDGRAALARALSAV